MASARVTNTDLHDLAGALRTIARRSTKRSMSSVVRKAAQRGNRNAQAFASEQHTMFSDVDVDYAPTFTVQSRGFGVYEFGPEDRGEGSKAPGYENGSVNQASPHRNLDRAVDVEREQFPEDVSEYQRTIWKEAGF